MHSPSREVLAKTVSDIAKKEGFELSPDAADLIAIAADGSFRDAIGVTQKVIMASGDTIGSADEVAAIIGAPKAKTLQNLLEALHLKKVENALEAVSEALEANADMKLFMRLLLERVRAVVVVRNAPNKQEKLLRSFSVSDQELIARLSKETPSALNSHLLIGLLTAAEQTGKTVLPQLPLELAIIESCSK